MRRDAFRSVEELITAIFDYVDHHNDNPKPFILTANASDIVERSNATAPRRIIGNLLGALNQRSLANTPNAMCEIFHGSSFANPLGRNQPDLQQLLNTSFLLVMKMHATEIEAVR